MLLNYDGVCGYDDGEELVLSSQFLQQQTTIESELNDEPVRNVVQNISGIPDMNNSNVDNEDIEDEEEMENIEVKGEAEVECEAEDFDEPEYLFAEENRILNARLEEIHLVYDTFPVNYSCDTDSYQCPGMVELTRFDVE